MQLPSNHNLYFALLLLIRNSLSTDNRQKYGRGSKSSASSTASLYEGDGEYAIEGLFDVSLEKSLLLGCAPYLNFSHSLLFLPSLSASIIFCLISNLLINSMYNNLVARCFDGCVTSFRSKALDKWEQGCVDHCASRYINMTQRVGLRFAEHQAMQQKRAEGVK